MFELTIGTTDQGYGEFGGAWRDGTWGGGFKGGYRAHPPGDGGAYALYSFFGLDEGDYLAQTHWVCRPTEEPWRSREVVYEVFDDDVSLAAVAVDQSHPPDEFWSPLGRYPIKNGIMRVMITSVPDNWVVADGVRVTK